MKQQDNRNEAQDNDRGEFLTKLIEDMTISEMKEFLASNGIAIKKKAKRPDLVEEILKQSKISPESVIKLRQSKASVSSVPLTSSDRSNSQESITKGRRRSQSGQNRRQRSSPARKRVVPEKTNESPKKQVQQSKKQNGVANGHLSAKAGAIISKNSNSMKPGNTSDHQEQIEEEISSLVVWRHPLKTFYYFGFDCVDKTRNLCCYMWSHRLTVLIAVSVLAILLGFERVDGPHQPAVKLIKANFTWCFYWIILGILSSVGLGTGLHTFLLYLGPHIASVTLAAFECNSVEFPSPPYPTEIICPIETTSVQEPMTMWKIVSKVRLESFMWGLGTALGELPPYFMARAARLSGTNDLDAELVELKELKELAEKDSSQVPWTVRCKIQVEKVVEKVGFPGILLMASIPNPLFDLAGITCGYLLVPFWQFFGATAIGKAVVKMHIQKIFVIMSFSEHHAERFVSFIGTLPFIGAKLQAPFQEFFVNEKRKLHMGNAEKAGLAKQSWLSWVFDKLVLTMVLYFVVSIVNSMAQSCYRRTHEKPKKKIK